MFLFSYTGYDGRVHGWLIETSRSENNQATHKVYFLTLKGGYDMESERTVEHALKHCVEKAGGVCYKFTSPSNAGVPDRIVVLRGRVVFVELKATGEKPRTLQKAVARAIRKAGGRVYCLSSVEQVTSFVKALRKHYPLEGDYDDI